MAREQFAAAEMIINLVLGKTEGTSRVEYFPQKTAFPDQDPWEPYFERVIPETQGISSEDLGELLRNLAGVETNQMHHFLMLRHGKMICECHFAPYRKEMWHATYSMCKSITGMAIGMLVEEGRLSLDEDIHDIFPDKVSSLAKIFKPEITVEHLLSMTSGVEFNETGIVSGNDWLEGFFNASLSQKSGSQFQYNSMNTYVLSAIVTRKTGETLAEYLRPRLFEPMGIRNYLWETCPKGITKGGWGLFLCTEDMAKLGQLALQKGMWEGQQLVPKEWIEQSTQKMVETGEGSFGYGWQIWKEEREGSFEFNGMMGQNVLIYPDLDLLVVTCAGSDEFLQMSTMLETIRGYISPEFAPPEQLPEDPSGYARLCSTIRELETGKKDCNQIRRGGWSHKGRRERKKSPAVARKALLRRLDGKCFEMEEKNVGLLPLILQVFQNNMTEGLRQVRFAKEKDGLLVWVLEGEDWKKIPVGFGGFQETWLDIKGESYLVSSRGDFTTDEKGRLVLNLDLAFLEDAAHRKVSIHFEDEDQVEMRWSETPGRKLIMDGLYAIMDEMKGNLLYDRLVEWGGMNFIYKIMAQTIEPVVRGKKIADVWDERTLEDPEYAKPIEPIEETEEEEKNHADT